jgi:hypothetical protein
MTAARILLGTIFFVLGCVSCTIACISLVSSGLTAHARIAAQEAREGWAFGVGALVLLAAAFALRSWS